MSYVGVPVEFLEIIADEIKIRAIWTDMAYPFSFLITRLCKDAKVPMVIGVDNRVKVKKKHSFDRSDKSGPTLLLGKGVSLWDDTPTTEGAHTPIITSNLHNVHKFY